MTLTFTPQQIGLCIVDDGIGFDLNSCEEFAGFGLLGMRERSSRVDGQLKLTSRPNAGTTIEVTLPLDPNGENNKF